MESGFLKCIGSSVKVKRIRWEVIVVCCWGLGEAGSGVVELRAAEGSAIIRQGRMVK